jgi:hypothetical protein
LQGIARQLLHELRLMKAEKASLSWSCGASWASRLRLGWAGDCLLTMARYRPCWIEFSVATGILRNRCDREIVFGETHLRRIVSMYAGYYMKPARTCR